jgi:hypothetical protein
MNRSSPPRAARAPTLRLAALVLLLLVAGCSTLLPTSYRYATVDVSVTDENGSPVPRAGLLLYTGVRHMAIGTTDRSGHYRFEHVPADGYGIYLSVVPVGYVMAPDDPGHRYVTVGRGDAGAVTFVLRRSPAAE